MVLCIYICSHIVLCRYVLYGIVLVLDDFILCKCLQFGFMFVNSQLIQYGCTYMALYFVVLRHCIALGPVLPGTPGDWPTSHKLMYCFAVKPWSFIWLCISHTQSYWNAVLVFNVHLIYGQESGYQASSFENLTSLYDPTVPHSPEFGPRTETSIGGLLLVVIFWSTQTVFVYLLLVNQWLGILWQMRVAIIEWHHHQHFSNQSLHNRDKGFWGINLNRSFLLCSSTNTQIGKKKQQNGNDCQGYNLWCSVKSER